MSITTPTPTPTVPLLPSQTPTETIEWFPPTETFTPVPTLEVTATPELLPGVGDILYRSGFNYPGEWPQSASEQGSINIQEGEITLALNQNGAYLFSVLPEPTFSDFYLEITASPSLCRGKDEYGLLFRASENISYYRYSLSCDGELRLDVVLGGSAYSPQAWMQSASVPSGAPSQSRLGVWARGSELRFFVNGVFQFAVEDKARSSGSLGVFARSAGENAVTISFSNLVVRELMP